MNALNLLADLNHVVREVNVTPAQSEHLAATKAVEREQQEGFVEPVTGGSRKEAPDFVLCPRADLLAFERWQHHKTSHIAHHNVFTLRVREHRGKNGPLLLDCARPDATLLQVVEVRLQLGNRKCAEELRAKTGANVQPAQRLVLIYVSGRRVLLTIGSQ